MKCFKRLVAAGSLLFLVGGVLLASAPISYAAQKRTAVEQEKEQSYVASKEGDKYHKPSCRLAKKIKAENKVTYGSEAEAKKDGKTPCGICKP